jgi:acetyl/propionyl-CoA carboxylase alpha subunit
VPEADGVRVDAGVVTGSEVGIHYDPMLAKIVAHAGTRPEAIDKMLGALGALAAEGVVTNREFLMRVLGHPAFARGETHTHFIEQHLAEPEADDSRAERERWAAVAAMLAGRAARLGERGVLPALEPGFRNNRFAPEHVEFRLSDRHVRVDYAPAGHGAQSVSVDGSEHRVRDVRRAGSELAFEDENGLVHRFRVSTRGEHFYVHTRAGSFTLVEVPRFPERQAVLAPGAAIAPMPGKVVKVAVAEGALVSAGDVLVVLEAMKMEHSVKSPDAGVVAELLVSVGEQVDADQVLAVVSAPSDS